MKLDIEQRELLLELVDHEGWPIILNVMQQICDSMGKGVLYYDLEQASPDGLCTRQSKYVGARQLYTQLLAAVDNFKAKKG